MDVLGLAMILRFNKLDGGIKIRDCHSILFANRLKGNYTTHIKPSFNGFLLTHLSSVKKTKYYLAKKKGKLPAHFKRWKFYL